MIEKNHIENLAGALDIEKLFAFPRSWEKLKDRRVSIVGLGKVAYRHVQSVAKIFSRVEQKIAVVPSYFEIEEGEGEKNGVRIIRGAHPQMEELSFMAGENLHRWLQEIPANVPLIICLSGGGSSLVEKAGPKLNPEFIKGLNMELLLSSAPIEEMNLIRMAVSGLKNGGLLLGMKTREIHLSILCDIPSGDADKVASSPFMFRTLDKMKIRQSGEKWLTEKFHAPLSSYLDSPDYAHFQEEKELHSQQFMISKNIVADGADALQTVISTLGSHAQNIGILSGDLNHAVELHLKKIKELVRGKKGTLVSGGELPIKVENKFTEARGGRNTHFVLALAWKVFFLNVLNLSPGQLEKISLLAFATDGSDGNTDVAGGFFNGALYRKALTLNLSPEEFLKTCSSYDFLKKLEHPAALIRLPKFCSNLMDVRIVEYCGEGDKHESK